MPSIKKQSVVIISASLLLLAMAPGCRRQAPTPGQNSPIHTIVITPSDTATPVASKVPSAEPTSNTSQDPAVTVTTSEPLLPDPSPSDTAVSDPLPIGLPHDVYVLTRQRPTSSAIGGPHQLWRLDNDTMALKMLSAADHDVTAMDIHPGDGRLAYGTSDGTIYLLDANQAPQLVYQAGLALAETLTISGLSWSPDGQELAFTCVYRDAYATGKTGGLWLLDLTNASASQLVGNRHLKAGDSDVSLFREFIDVDFSPDGQALLLLTSFWEYADVLVMRPLAFDQAEANLYELEGWWRDGAWSSDGSSILLSEWNQGMATDLAQSWLDEERQERLVDGRQASLFIRFPRQLPDGIAFVASEVSGERGYQLFLGANQGDGFQYETAGGSQPLCSGDFVTGVDWDSTGEVALVACYNSAEARSLDGSVSVDLTPYLAPLLERDMLELFWGADQEGAT